MGNVDLALAIENFISTQGITHSDSIEYLIDALYANDEQD